MEKVGFIGAYDKTDLIIYVAKILTVLKKKVLVVDMTTTQKARYIVPVINPTKSYITEYEGIDIAVGFSNEEDIKKYLGINEGQKMEYDIMIVDTDNERGFEKFELNTSFKNYFVTSFDAYSLKKGLEAVIGLKETTKLTKILYSQYILKEEDDYLNFLSQGYKVIWDDEEKIYFPLENGDLTVISENQRVSKIKFKRLSVQYKDNLVSISKEILKDVKESEIRRTIKTIERGV